MNVRGNFGAAINYNGEVYTWGSNENGELGLGDYVARPQGNKVNSIQGKIINGISCGGSYVIALGKNVPHKYSKAVKTTFEYKPSPIREQEIKTDIPPPITKPKDNQNDILIMYDNELQQCKKLEQRLAQLKTLKRPIHNSSAQDDLKIRLRLAEEQLENEKNNSAKLLNELNSISLQAGSINTQEIQQLQRTVEELKEQNSLLRDENAIPSVGGNLKVSEVLKDYENRIENEIQERRKITKEKNDEIRSLNEVVTQNENTITSLRRENTKMKDYYSSELNKTEINVDETKKILMSKISDREALVELKNRDELEEQRTMTELEQVNNEVSKSDLYMKDLLAKLDDEKHILLNTQNDLQITLEKEKEISVILKEKEFIYDKGLINLKDAEEMSIKDMGDYKVELSEKTIINDKFKESLARKLTELDSLNSDMDLLIGDVNKARQDNNNLRIHIEDLEGKNRSIMTSINPPLGPIDNTIQTMPPSNSHRGNMNKPRYVTPSPNRVGKSAIIEDKGYSRSAVSEFKGAFRNNRSIKEDKYQKERFAQPKNMNEIFILTDTKKNISEDDRRIYTNPKRSDELHKLEKIDEEKELYGPSIQESHAYLNPRTEINLFGTRNNVFLKIIID